MAALSVFFSSFRGEAQPRTQNLEIPDAQLRI
jgi:hypothetical protein